MFSLVLTRSVSSAGTRYEVGHPLLDEYLDFVGSRGRPNTLRAVAYDLKTFFNVVGKPPTKVATADVVDFIRQQRHGSNDRTVVRMDGDSGVSARTIQRRLSSVSGLYAYLLAREAPGVRRNPVPQGLATRRERSRPRQAIPLVRVPRTLPRILAPEEVDSLLAALRSDRDRAMVEAMLLGGLRRCEVLGLRIGDLRVNEHRVFVNEGKGGHQRLVPMSRRFFVTVGRYMAAERPAESSTDRVFVVLKGPNRGRPLSPAGLDEIMKGAKQRAGLDHATCHELRHTCLTRLRQAGMPLEAVQAQAGHRSIESTRLYVHLADPWLADEYRRAAEAIDAQTLGMVQ